MEFVNTGPASFFFSSGLLFLILLSCYGAGGAAFQAAGMGESSFESIEYPLFSAGLGLIGLGACVFFLGSAGLLKRWVFFGIVGAGVIAACRRGVRPRMAMNFKDRKIKILAAFAFCAFLLSFLRCGIPPIGNDALAYHLADAKEFILNGRIAPIPLSRESLWPYQTEMLFTLGLLLAGTTLAQMLHWIFYPLSAGLLYCFGARFLGKKEAAWASLIWIFTPVAFQQSSEAYVDLALVFFVFLSFYFFMLKDFVGPAKAALFSGFFCGAALATKYLALVPAVILAAYWLFQKTGRRLKNLLFFCAGLALVSGVWYLRSALILGNPVYPFLPGLFGGRGFDFGITLSLGMGQGPMAFFFLPWNLTLYPKAFGGNWIGPLYLLFALPAFLLAHKFKKALWMLSAFAFFYSFAVFKTVPQARFFLPVLPFFSLLAGFALARISEGPKAPARLAAVIFLGVLLFHLGIYAYRSRDVWSILSGAETAEAFLLKKERSYPGYRYLNQAPKGAKIFNAIEPRRFYGENRSTVMDGPPLRNHLAGSHQSLADFLGRERFDFIWVSPLSDKQVLDFISSRSYRRGFSYRFEEGGVPFDYQIYARSLK